MQSLNLEQRHSMFPNNTRPPLIQTRESKVQRRNLRTLRENENLDEERRVRRHRRALCAAL